MRHNTHWNERLFNLSGSAVIQRVSVVGRFCSVFLCTVFLVFILTGQVSAAEQGTWREADFDGVKVAYLEAGNPEAPALVFVHGWSSDASFWRLQVPDFSRSHHVIVVDLPGFGTRFVNSWSRCTKPRKGPFWQRSFSI